MLKKFKAEITTTLKGTVAIEAENKEDALKEIEKSYSTSTHFNLENASVENLEFNIVGEITMKTFIVPVRVIIKYFKHWTNSDEDVLRSIMAKMYKDETNARLKVDEIFTMGAFWVYQKVKAENIEEAKKEAEIQVSDFIEDSGIKLTIELIYATENEDDIKVVEE